VSKADAASLSYLVAAICFVLALKGLSTPRGARRGNLLGALGAVIAVVTVLVTAEIDNMVPILGAIAVGTAIGVPAAQRVAMTSMPQLVALFNGVGGAAAALVALLELREHSGEVVSASYGWTAYAPLSDVPVPELASDTSATVALVASAFTVLIGAVSTSGSVVTFLKLQELMTTRPIVFRGLRELAVVSSLVAVALAVVVSIDGTLWAALLLALLGLGLGALLVLPVGGADVPIVISLLNAFTGLAVAASGYVLGNVLLLVAGTLVGASGTILTRLMASAMGRSIAGIMFGALKGGSTAGAGTVSDRPVRTSSPEDVAILLGYARKVIVVPGYGLAVAQAQHTIQELAELLEAKGIEVSYAIHPVAGRMPGHMNVLLAEANVPYEALREMDEINPEFARTDVTLVVGANDVVNPAARTSPGSPIYGMPILDVDESRQVVFLKRSMRPGFAGIENELLYDPRTSLLFGDAKDTLAKVVQQLKLV